MQMLASCKTSSCVPPLLSPSDNTTYQYDHSEDTWQYEDISSLISISGGGMHVCGVTSSGCVWCTGDDSNGQSSPPTECGVSQVAAGGRHTCALYDNGEVRCWGCNGNTTAGQKVDIGQCNPPRKKFRKISAGWSYTCGISDIGELFCWGSLNEPIRDQEDGVSDRYVDVIAGPTYYCAMDSVGDIICLGNQIESQIYNVVNAGNFDKLSIGHGSFCSIQVKQEHPENVSNTSYVLHTSQDIAECIDIDGTVYDYTEIEAAKVVCGNRNSCIVTTDGVCWCHKSCFSGKQEQIADDIKDAAIGLNYTCLLRNTGDLRCCFFEK